MNLQLLSFRSINNYDTCTEADRSPASDLEDHILTFVNQFGPGQLEVIGYLKSDSSGSTQCRIDEIDIGYK